MKWTKPFDGACPQLVMGEYRYFIQDIMDCTMVAIFRTPAKRVERHRFETFRDMCKSLLGKEPNDDQTDEYYALNIKLAGYVEHGMWGYKDEKTGRLYALNFREKEYHEYFEPEKVSPAFDTIPDAKAWAEEYLEKMYGDTEQLRLDI